MRIVIGKSCKNNFRGVKKVINVKGAERKGPKGPFSGLFAEPIATVGTFFFFFGNN